MVAELVLTHNTFASQQRQTNLEVAESLKKLDHKIDLMTTQYKVIERQVGQLAAPPTMAQGMLPRKLEYALKEQVFTELSHNEALSH